MKNTPYALDGIKLSQTLLLISNIVLVLGILLSAILLLGGFIGGIVLAAKELENSFFLVFFGGLIGSFCTFFLTFLISLIIKSLGAIVLNTYITAMNSEK